MDLTLSQLTEQARRMGLDRTVFVYGTLMRGRRAAHLMDGALFYGDALLRDYAMYDLGRYPGIRPLPGGQVQGELFLLSDDMLAEMDAYEEEGSLYHRVEVTAEGTDFSLPVWVYVYAHPVSGEPINGRWIDK